jgi:hypothetical protein
VLEFVEPPVQRREVFGLFTFTHEPLVWPADGGEPDRSSTRTTTSPDPGSGRHSLDQVPVAAVGAGNHPQTGRCRGRTSCCTACRTLTASDRQSSPRCALQMSSLGSKPAILQWRIDAVETGRPVMPRQIITTADAPSSPLYSLAGVSGLAHRDRAFGQFRRAV